MNCCSAAAALRRSYGMLKFLKKNGPTDCISVVSLYSSDIGPGAYSGRSEPSDKKRGGAGGGRILIRP